ncbi:MAG: Porphobilinogen deaminase [Hydrogenibacillus schlegelii]|uniref:Porphobilinogen deaminase n=1 Tax=Hydrogenibacillus schlegelii TaxID=1484 RepID=A0A2T5GB80_HYDSH|nr:hydroxymethylbilane synthase [Hydrogenibacillus schlegelii]PTQ53447.1 MAG: Porphobilinogen deaminase [Hydrogenibacillus schlegelii]
MPELVLASRKSPLALAQSEGVRALLESRYPALRVRIAPYVTEGDRRLEATLAKIGGKGLFVKELERAMLSGEADFAVHSLKDVPAMLPEGLALVAILARGPVEDVLITRDGRELNALPPGAVVGTSSLRRTVLLRRLRPDLDVRPLRGNVDTRLRRLMAGDFDAIVLARAGVERLGLDVRSVPLDPTAFIPAVGQGALAIEARRGDGAVLRWLEPFDDAPTRRAVEAERAFLARLGGSCQVPLGAYGTVEVDGTVTLRGFIAEPDGSGFWSGVLRGPSPDVGTALAERLIAEGAGKTVARFAAGEDDDGSTEGQKA